MDKNISEIFNSMRPEMVKAMTCLIGLAAIGCTINTQPRVERRVYELTEDQKRKQRIRRIDSEVIRNREHNNKVMNRSGSKVCDSYISWMTQTDMDSIMDAYNEYKELGI